MAFAARAVLGTLMLLGLLLLGLPYPALAQAMGHDAMRRCCSGMMGAGGMWMMALVGVLVLAATAALVAAAVFLVRRSRERRP